MSTQAKDRALRRALADPATLPRFHALVAAEPTAAGCRLWLGPLSNGNPILTVGRSAVQPKRVAWYAAHGVVAATGWMVPTCGDPRCVAPAHLEWRSREWGE